MWEEEKKVFLHRQFFSCSISIPTPLPGRPCRRWLFSGKKIWDFQKLKKEMNYGPRMVMVGNFSKPSSANSSPEPSGALPQKEAEMKKKGRLLTVLMPLLPLVFGFLR